MSVAVFHFSSLGVTEYPDAATSLSGDYMATAEGVFRVSSDTVQAGSFTIPLGSDSSGKKRSPVCAHVLAEGGGVLQCVVRTTDGEYPYLSLVGSDRQRKIVFGRGIRDNHLEFEFSSPTEEEFKIEQIDLTLTVSETRRI